MPTSIGCIDTEPCNECKNIMEQGIIFISTKDDDREYRTGGWCAITESAVQSMPIDGDMKQSIIESRVCFIQNTTYDILGLPRNVEINNL